MLYHRLIFVFNTFSCSNTKVRTIYETDKYFGRKFYFMQNISGLTSYLQK